MKTRTKTIAIVMSLLICVAMLGVGFAAWIIVGNSEEVANGNITAESVTDNAVKLEITASDETLYFGAPATSQSSGDWLINDNPGKEDLSISFTVKITGNLGALSATIGVASADEGAWKAVTETKEYIKPTISVVGGDEYVTFNSGSQTFTVVEGKSQLPAEGVTLTVTVTFNWGSDLNNQNPYNYFNALEYNSTNATNAKTALEAIYALNSKTIKVTFIATGSTNAAN